MTAACGARPECRWEADLFNEGKPDAHYAVTCYTPDGPAEVCTINPDLPLDEARAVALLIASAPTLVRVIRAADESLAALVVPGEPQPALVAARTHLRRAVPA